MQQNDGATPAPPERAEDIPPETGKKNDSYDVAAADAAVAAGAVAQVFENEPPRGVKDACGGKKLKKAVGAEGFVCLVLVAGFFCRFRLRYGLFQRNQHHVQHGVHAFEGHGVLSFGSGSAYGRHIRRAQRVRSGVFAQQSVCAPHGTVVRYAGRNLDFTVYVLSVRQSRRAHSRKRQKLHQIFQKYQLGALTNIGTAFGMGLIVVVSMLSLNGEHFGIAVVVGLLSVFLTSILVTRLMLLKTKKVFGKDEPALKDAGSAEYDVLKMREVREGGVFQRLISSLLDGGAGGVKVGVSIIPGVLIIATLVLMLTNGKPEGGYTGGVGEGVGLIPMIGSFLSPVLKPLFGFGSPEIIAVPLTALGSAGAAIGLVPEMMSRGIITASNVAVLTAMCMFWSGYLSTHVSMMDALNFRSLTGWSIMLHTVGGLVAGLLANGLFALVSLLL